MKDGNEDFYARPVPGGQWEEKLLRLLSTPKTRRELERRLRALRCPDETALDLLDRFEEAGLIDDRAYAVLYIDSKRDFGVLRLRDELRNHGVNAHDIEDALEECGVDEAGRARDLVERWKGQNGMTPEKIVSRLRRRGFSTAAVREAEDLCGSCPESDDV